MDSGDTAPRKRAGREAHPADPASRQLVEQLCMVGTKQEEIAAILNISPKTLRKAYRRELDTAAPKANARVAANVFAMATGNGREALPAAQFWLRTRANWRDESDDGGFNPLLMFEGKSDADLEALARTLASQSGLDLVPAGTRSPQAGAREPQTIEGTVTVIGEDTGASTP